MDELKKPEKEISLDGIDIEEEAKGAIAGATPEITPNAKRNKQLNDMSSEPKVYLGGKTTEEQFVPSKLNIQSSGAGRRVLFVLGLLLLITAVLVAVWALLEKEKATTDLSSTQARLAEAEVTANRYKLALETATSKNAPSVTEEQPTPTEEEKISLAANSYACLLTIQANTCDKAVVKVIKQHAETPNTPGFAVAHIMTGPNADQVVARLLLKKGSVDWAVLYEGTTVPADIVKKFTVPNEYQAL